MRETSHISILVKIPARDEITSHVIWPARPLVSISENELNRHLRHLQPWNYMTSLFLALRQLSRAFSTHTRATDTVCTGVRAREQMSTWKIVIIWANASWARNTRPRTSQSFTYAFWSTEASELPPQLGEEEEDEGDDGAGRAHPQCRSLPICSILLSKWAIVRYALPKRQVCPPRRAVKEEFLSRVVDVCASSSVPIRAWSLTFLSKQVK